MSDEVKAAKDKEIKIEKLEKLYQKEQAAALAHGKRAEEYKEQLDIARGKAVQKAISSVNLNGEEFQKLMSLLKLKNIKEAIESLEKEGMVQKEKERKENVESDPINDLEYSDADQEGGECIHET